MSRPRGPRALPRSRLVTWLWVGCAAAAGFPVGLLLGAGDGWAAVAGALVAGAITYAVRRPRTLVRIAEAWAGSEEDESSWDRMRQREIVRRRRESARQADASVRTEPAGATPRRRFRRLGRWRRKYPSEDGPTYPPVF